MIDNKQCILIVDDEVKIVQGLKDFFNAKNYHVLTANHGQEAMVVYEQFQKNIDIILLDVMMPVMDGYETLTYLRGKSQSLPIVMLTAKSQPEDELKGFDLDADDYIAKPFLPSLLLARIERILERGFSEKNEFNTIEDVGDIKIIHHKQVIEIEGDEIEVTKKEFDLIVYLIQNKNRILSREQLIDQVWSSDFNGDVRTIDTHIKQLRSKLGHLSYRIKTAHGVGYLFEVDDENDN